MPRPKKEVVEQVQPQPNDNINLHVVFTAAALAGLIARGTGQSIEMICQSAMTYADAMLEKYK